MISAGDFKNGLTFDMDGDVMQIVEFQHVKPGKGAAFVRTTIRNVITGAVTEKTFNPTEKFQEAYIERREMEYLYSDDNLYYFMDTETYEQQAIDSQHLGDGFRFVELKVTKTEPGFKGNTATNATKPATLETGAEIKVPLFIDEGEMIRVDTRTGEYMQRA
mgnify:CR=1 FL=1